MIRFQFRETLLLSLLVLGALVLLLIFGVPSAGRPAKATTTLVLYCAAGLQPPVSEIVSDYSADNPVEFQTRFDGSGTLLSQIRVAGGDIFVAADKQYLLTAREM